MKHCLKHVRAVVCVSLSDTVGGGGGVLSWEPKEDQDGDHLLISQ